MTQKQINWNLSELFSGPDDPKINQTITQTRKLANKFEKTYKGKIVNLNPTQLLSCLKDIEEFQSILSNISLYSSLCFAANMTLPQNQTLYDKICKLKACLGKQLAFFGIELANLLKKNPQIINEHALRNYQHRLERVYRDAEHNLSEVEEQIIIEKDQFGENTTPQCTPAKSATTPNNK